MSAPKFFLRVLLALILVSSLGAGARVKELRGIVHERDVTLALLTLEGGKPTWIKVGQKLGENLLVLADPLAEFAIVQDEKGEKYKLPLLHSAIREMPQIAKIQPPANFISDPRMANFKAPPYVVYESYPELGAKRSNEGLNWNFILSDRNDLRNPYPLFRTYMGPNGSADWLLLGAEQKAELLERLRQHGWHMQVTVSSHGLGITALRIGRTDPAEIVFPATAGKEVVQENTRNSNQSPTPNPIFGK